MTKHDENGQPPEDEVDPPPPFLVGVGASAGGLQALEEFFREVPRLEQVAFVVIQHLSPDYKSMMAELLGKHTELTVMRAEHGTKVRGGYVYVIPPKKNLTISGGRLFLIDLPDTRTFNLPIDVFFRSLAEAYEEKAIAVILSGTGSDGTLGIREVKGAGGVVLAQEPESARFDGMPRSAIATRVVDDVLEPAQIGRRIVDYVTTTATPFLPPETVVKEAPDAVARVLGALKEYSSVDFSVYRFGTLLRRIHKRMQMARLDDLGRYARYLEESRSETAALYRDVLIGVTSFFRDREAFEALRAAALPPLIAAAPVRSTLRVWSVGCSTGEEAYSVAAMLTSELERGERNDLNLKVFATDIDADALQLAAAGVYPMSAMLDIPPDLLARYFTKDGDSYRVSEALRRSVIFSRHNICADPPFNRIDLISCRNLLIYFRPEIQQQVLGVFNFALQPEGMLFLGHSETLGDESNGYRVLNQRWKIYRRIADTPRPALHSLSVPTREDMRLPGEPELYRSQRSASTARLEQRIFRRVMGRYAPASVVVDSDMRAIMSFGDINRFLSLPIGQIDLDIVSLAGSELSAVLSTVTYRLTKTHERVVYKGVSIADDDSVRLVDIVAEPLDRRDGRELFIILFEERRRTKSDEDDADAAIRYDTSQHVTDLKNELQYTRETLQATIEELETSNEELQATNEELLASNEELQSTNEELQSVNEELVTVNTEHQEKIKELTEVNNDIENLLVNTRLGVIFLDKRMCVRRYTPAVRSIVNLLPADLGRSLQDLSFRLRPTQDLVTQARHVLETLIPEERELSGADGSTYQLSIVPYRTTDDMIQGVVLVFMDVSERRKLTAELEAARRRLLAGAGEAKKDRALRVLLVEDEADDIELIRRSLEHTKLHCDLRVAQTLAEGRKEVFDADGTPELVLLDLGLPDGDGADLLKEIKQSAKHAQIPVVIVSASDDEDRVRAAYDQQAACFVSKDLGFADLGEIVRSIGEFWLAVVRLPDVDSSA